MHRRRLLATCGLVTAGSLSGCVDLLGTEETPGQETGERGQTTATAGSRTTAGGVGRTNGSTGADGTPKGERGPTETGTENAPATDDDPGGDSDSRAGGRVDPSLPHRLRFIHTGGKRVFYEVAVTGVLAHTWAGAMAGPGGHQDAIHHDRTRLSGSVVENDEDAFAFQGELVTLAIDGPAVASLDGERVRSDRTSLGADLPGSDSGATSTSSVSASAARATGLAVSEHRYRERPAGLDVLALSIENGTEDSIERVAAYVAFYDRDGSYRFGTNAYMGSTLAPGAAFETSPERPFGEVSVATYRVFLASTRHDAWTPATERTSL